MISAYNKSIKIKDKNNTSVAKTKIQSKDLLIELMDVIFLISSEELKRI